MEHGPPPAEPANPYSHVSAPEEDDPFHGDAPHLSPQPEEDEDPLPPPQYVIPTLPLSSSSDATALFNMRLSTGRTDPGSGPSPRMYENNAKLMDPEPSLGSGCCTAAPVPMPMPLSDDREPVDGTPIPSVAVGITLGYHTEANPNPAGPQNPSAVLPGQGQQPPQTEVQLESQGAPRGQWQESVWAFYADTGTFWDALLCPCVLASADFDALFHPHRVQMAGQHNCNCPIAFVLCVGMCCSCCMLESDVAGCGICCGCWPFMGLVGCLLRQKMRRKYNIGGLGLASPAPSCKDKGYDCLEDFLTSCYCMPCVLAQQHRELVRRGDYKGSVVFSSSTSLAPVVPQ